MKFKPGQLIVVQHQRGNSFGLVDHMHQPALCGHEAQWVVRYPHVPPNAIGSCCAYPESEIRKPSLKEQLTHWLRDSTALPA